MISTDTEVNLSDLENSEIGVPSSRETKRDWTVFPHHEIVTEVKDTFDRLGVETASEVFWLSHNENDMVACWLIGNTYATILNLHNGTTPLRLYIGVECEGWGIPLKILWSRKHEGDKEGIGTAIAQSICYERVRMNSLKRALTTRWLDAAQQIEIVQEATKRQGKWNNNAILPMECLTRIITGEKTNQLTIMKRSGS